MALFIFIADQLMFVKQHALGLKYFILILHFLMVCSFNCKADSPITSTHFFKAYEDECIVQKAAAADGVLTLEIMEFMANDTNRADLKLAALNRLVYDQYEPRLSQLFLSYFTSQQFFIDEEDFTNNAPADLLICYAYLMAFEDRNLKNAIAFARSASWRSQKSYTIHMVAALIESTKYLRYGEYCRCFQVYSKVKENKSLRKDLKPEADDIIFEYMNLYEKYCEG
ncbi:hypothetical protein [Jiulongibacter sp. NS-SX5]|uniref:hypothetical protein n=1 Tax=Jiulongibacter sp. NS-SX5 TaxID=3463854 RepID=UPI004057DC1C